MAGSHRLPACKQNKTTEIENFELDVATAWDPIAAISIC